jgi:tetratricopeptide (TPR) repeat protein
MSAGKSNEYYRQGLAALDGQSYESAADWFSRVGPQRGRDLRARLGVGLVGRWGPVADRRAALQTIQLDADHVKAYTARAKAYELLGQLRDALGDAREVVRLSPNSHKVSHPDIVAYSLLPWR